MAAGARIAGSGLQGKDREFQDARGGSQAAVCARRLADSATWVAHGGSRTPCFKLRAAARGLRDAGYGLYENTIQMNSVEIDQN